MPWREDVRERINLNSRLDYIKRVLLTGKEIAEYKLAASTWKVCLQEHTCMDCGCTINKKELELYSQPRVDYTRLKIYRCLKCGQTLLNSIEQSHQL